MTFQTKVAGTWKPAENIYTKVSGSWREAEKVYLKVSGEWKEVWTSGIRMVNGYLSGNHSTYTETDTYIELYAYDDEGNGAAVSAVTNSKVDLTNVNEIAFYWESDKTSYMMSDAIMTVSNNKNTGGGDYVYRWYRGMALPKIYTRFDVSSLSGSYYIKAIASVNPTVTYKTTVKLYKILFDDVEVWNASDQ